MRYLLFILFNIILSTISFAQDTYKDIPFLQERVHFYKSLYKSSPKKAVCDRNGSIQVLSGGKLHKPYKEILIPDKKYLPIYDMNISDVILYKNQFVYLTDKAVLSNAWAGKLYIEYSLDSAYAFAGGDNYSFLIANNNSLEFVSSEGKNMSESLKKYSEVIEIKFDTKNSSFLILTSNELLEYQSEKNKLKKIINGDKYRGFEIRKNGDVVIATEEGYFVYNRNKNTNSAINKDLPCNRLNSVTEIDGNLWFASDKGAFMLRDDGKFNYYASRRWLMDNKVTDIAKGENNSILILSEKGLSQINFEETTLYSKAMYFENQVRKRHIRNGFNCDSYVMDVYGDLSSGYMVDSDNDGLWTSMYLASQLFRYKVTGSEEALLNALESFDAMERLNDINGIKGFPSRSFERSSYAKHGRENWHQADDEKWEWKGTTSSDEAVGHYLAFSMVLEFVDDEDVKKRALKLLLEMTDHIIDNDLYYVDVDGKPTRWGRWNPDYVNKFNKSVGDRKLNSSNIIAFLQAAYHFSGDEKYKTKAYELIDNYGYLENLSVAMSEIGVVDFEDKESQDLSDSWNHSDDEMYFLSYWYLYRYAFNDKLKAKYYDVIKDHWNIERPEKDGLWNLSYALIGAEEFDLDNTIWYLKEFPLDMISWSINNSGRKDLEFLPDNFREQTTSHVLPPDERPVFKHNTNTFTLDSGDEGRVEYSGDIYLLPYWMGRYLGVISEPKNK
ncbi:MAG: hypothetical protein ABFR62_04355 [Bacteroidota bacterium]